MGEVISISNILFVVALIGFAFWKKDWLRIILSIAIVVWGVHFMASDIFVGMSVLAVGIILFIMGIRTQIQQTRGVSE